MPETQRSVSEWAAEAFGLTKTKMRIAVRAQEELTECLKELAVNDHSLKAVEEAADTVIALWVLAERMGMDLQKVIDAKMAVNRSREWVKDGSGCGYHKK